MWRKEVGREFLNVFELYLDCFGVLLDSIPGLCPRLGVGVRERGKGWVFVGVNSLCHGARQDDFRKDGIGWGLVVML